MQNHVTAETAMKLKEAGFPQPEPEVGQVWYNELGSPSVIVRNMGAENGRTEPHYSGCSLVDGRIGNDFSASQIHAHAFFAATATDLLRQIEPIVYVAFLNESFAAPDALAEIWIKLKKK